MALFFDGSQVCATVDPEIFFPEQNKKMAKIARQLCGTCAFIDPCREWALKQRDLHGVWGGTTERMRENIRGARRKAAAA